MIAVEIYKKHWRGWVEINYGKDVADEATFEEVQHAYIIAGRQRATGTSTML